jgi:Xaa-Pro aminopeptidase
MITMENVLKRGRATWDRDALPEDEYRERVRLAREATRRAGLDALVVLGHSSRYGDSTYFNGAIPMMGWAAVVVDADPEQEPAFITTSGPRERPFLKTQTWMERIVTSSSLFAGPAAGIIEVLGEPGSTRRRVGVAGARPSLEADAYDGLVAALEGFEVHDADDLLAGLRAVKRPREHVALERALAIARAAAAAASDAFTGGAQTADAMLAAERCARRGGAQDVRVLADLGDGGLSPLEGREEGRTDELVLYCAVEVLGYWAEAVAAPAASAAAGAVAAMRDAARPGATGGDLAAEAVAGLPQTEADIALAYGLGGGIGLSLAEAPVVRPGGTDVLREGAVLALRAITSEGGRLTAAAETVRVRADGAVAL